MAFFSIKSQTELASPLVLRGKTLQFFLLNNFVRHGFSYEPFLVTEGHRAVYNGHLEPKYRGKSGQIYGKDIVERFEERIEIIEGFCMMKHKYVEQIARENKVNEKKLMGEVMKEADKSRVSNTTITKQKNVPIWSGG